MKKRALCWVLAVSWFMGVRLAIAGSDVSFSANINVGNEPNVVYLEEQPEFICPPALGFYVAVGIPYDMFFLNARYYLHRGDVWYASPSYNGPWAVVRYRSLPRGFRRHDYNRIIAIRDEEYITYQRDRSHYKGKYYRPEKQGRGYEHGKGRGEGHGEGHGHGRGR